MRSSPACRTERKRSPEQPGPKGNARDRRSHSSRDSNHSYELGMQRRKTLQTSINIEGVSGKAQSQEFRINKPVPFSIAEFFGILG